MERKPPLLKLGAFLLFAVLCAPALGGILSADCPVTYYVDTGGWYDGPVATATYHPSATPIQSAIDSASDSYCIVVMDGSYSENIIINKSIHLVSEEGPSNCTITAANSSLDVIKISYDNVTVDGLGLKGANAHYFVCGVQLTSGRYCTITNCIISDCYEGVYAQQSGDIVIANNIILNISNYGILFMSAVNADIYGNVLDNASIGISSWGGGSNSAKIRNNTVTGCRDGIHCSGSTRTNITGNSVSGCTSGIRLVNVYQPYIAYNDLRSNGNNTYDSSTDAHVWEYNFYSDYAGVDANHDGIGDTPYNITGGPSQDPYPAYKDITSPTVTSLSPFHGAMVGNDRPLITASFDDRASGSGVNSSSVVILVNGGDVTSLASVDTSGFAYIPANSIPNGMVNVVVSFSDNAGNQAYVTWSFSVDTVAPTISGAVPVNGTLTNNPQMAISALFSDSTSGINASSARIFVNGISVTSLANASQSGIIYVPAALLLLDGTTTATFSVSDLAGNAASETVVWTIDTVAPPAPNSTTTNGTSITSGLYVFNATYSGIGPLPGSVTITLDGANVTSAAAITATALQYNATLAAGSHTIVVSVKDAAGNTASSSWIINAASPSAGGISDYIIAILAGIAAAVAIVVFLIMRDKK